TGSPTRTAQYYDSYRDGKSRLSEAELARIRGRHRLERAVVIELLHRHSGLKVSVVYRVPDGLNDLNGLNCLNEQRSLPSGLEVWLRVGEATIAGRSGENRY